MSADLANAPDVMTLEQASPFADLLPDTLRQAIYRNSLKATMVEGVWHVSRVHLEEYLNHRPTRIGAARRKWADKRLPRRPDHVTTRDWSVFRQYVREDKTYAEIGEPLGLTAEAVRKIVNRVDLKLGDQD